MRFRRSFSVLAVLWAVSLPAAAQRGQSRAATDPAGAVAAFDRGVILHERGQLDAAIREYETAIRLDPTYYKTYNNLGNAYSDKGDLAHASPMYAKAIELNPNYALAHYNFGLLLQKIGDEGDAARAFRQACAIDPRHPVFCSYADSVKAPARPSVTAPARPPAARGGAPAAQGPAFDRAREIGLPVFPGATPSGPGGRVEIELEGKLKKTYAFFETRETLAAVLGFYRGRVNAAFQQEKDGVSSTDTRLDVATGIVTELRVTITPSAGKTMIELRRLVF